ncbi:unnamed protein product [Linum trigynum]|uniref:Uncharacterized protein n=2 Tax=Linum trigynum TaxID=586398 RepID=A0AAV2DWS0_9ROSI
MGRQQASQIYQHGAKEARMLQYLCNLRKRRRRGVWEIVEMEKEKTVADGSVGKMTVVDHQRDEHADAEDQSRNAQTLSRMTCERLKSSVRFSFLFDKVLLLEALCCSVMDTVQDYRSVEDWRWRETK